MRKNIEHRKLEGVRLTGYRRGKALAARYASGDAFVFPSDAETFGNVVMEAFAIGLGHAARSFARTRTWPRVIDGLLQEYVEVVGGSMYTGRSEIYS